MAKQEPQLTNIDFASRDVRRAEISDFPKIASEVYPSYSITKKLDVKSIPVNFLIYRMENGRTRSQQAAFASKSQKTRAWFSEHSEDQSTQMQQHRFLWNLAQERASSEGISIVQALKTARVQTKPLLITADGEVVDGNRRLATMRELSEIPEFSDFQYAACAILPPETKELDIRLLEVAVQMAPETKLRYSWVNDGLTYRSLIDFGFNAESIAENVGHGVRATAIRERVSSLDEADIYLSEYANEPENYDLVEKAYTAFKNLSSATRAANGESEKERIRALSYPLISHAKALGERVYSYIQPLKDDSKLTRVYDLISARGEIKPPKSTVKISNDDSDLFADLEEDDVSEIQVMAQYIGDPANSEEVYSAVKNAAEAMLEEKRQGAIEEKPLKIVKKAVGDLNPFSGDDIYPEYAKALKSQAELLILKLEEFVEAASNHLDADD